MSKTPERPATGGSYRRQTDGALKRVASTAPAEPAKAPAPAAEPKPADSKPGDSKSDAPAGTAGAKKGN